MADFSNTPIRPGSFGHQLQFFRQRLGLEPISGAAGIEATQGDTGLVEAPPQIPLIDPENLPVAGKAQIVTPDQFIPDDEPRDSLPPEAPPEGEPLQVVEDQMTPGNFNEQDSIIYQDPDELARNPLFIPARYVADEFAARRTVSNETLQFLANVDKIKTDNGWDVETWKHILKSGAAQTPKMVWDALRALGPVGEDLWNVTLAGKTDEEKALAFGHLIAAWDLGTEEMAEAARTILAPVTGGMEAYMLAKQGASAGDIARRFGGETLRRLVTLSGGILWAQDQLPSAMNPMNYVESVLSLAGLDMAKTGRTMRGTILDAIDAFDPQDPVARLLNNAQRYRELDDRQKGKGGYLGRALGLSGELLEQAGTPLDPERIDLGSYWVSPDNLGGFIGGMKAPKVSAKLAAKAATAATKPVAAKGLAGIAGEAVRKRVVDAAQRVGPAARGAVARPIVTAGKSAEKLGKYFQGRIAGIAVASGLAGAMMSGNFVAALAGLGILAGSGIMEKVGKKLAKAGYNFAQGEGFLEWMRKRAATTSKGVVGGYVATIPLAGLMDDPEMAASVMASGGLGALGANTAEAMSAVRDGTLSRFHGVWDEAKKAPVQSAPYDATGPYAQWITDGNKSHDANIRTLASTGDQGRRSAATISRVRETLRQVTTPDGVTRPTRIFLRSRPEFAQLYGHDAHGVFSGIAPDGAFEINLSEDATGMGHETGHLFDALLSPDLRDRVRKKIIKVYGDNGVESFREAYEILKNQGRTAGTPAHSMTTEQALDEMAAEHWSLIVRGSPLEGVLGTEGQVAVEKIFGLLQQAFTPLKPKATEGTATAGLTLGMEPSAEVVQEMRQAAQEGGLPTAPIAVVPTGAPMGPAPTPPQTPPPAAGGAPARAGPPRLRGAAPAATPPPLPTAAPTAPTAPAAPTPAPQPVAPTRRRTAGGTAPGQLELPLGTAPEPAPAATPAPGQLELPLGTAPEPAPAPAPVTATPEPAPVAPTTPATVPEAPAAPTPAPELQRPPTVDVVPRATPPTPRPAATVVDTEEERLRPTLPEPGKRLPDVRDLNDIGRILNQVENDPKVDENSKQVLRQLAMAARELPAGAGANVATIRYESVKPQESKTESRRRQQRRAEQAAAYYREALEGPEVREETREIFTKNTIPYRFDVTSQGAVQVLGMSPDKVLNNATILLSDLMGSPKLSDLVAKWFPPAWEFAKTADGYSFTPAGLDALAQDLATYGRNHANGYTGQGQRIKVPEGYQRFIPEPSPGFAPGVLPKNTATVLNALMGLTPPLTTRKVANMGVNPETGARITVPANVEAQILATENRLQPVPSKFAKPTKKGEAPTFEGGYPIAEVNPFRDELAGRGYDAKESTTEAVERLNLADIVGVAEVAPTALSPISVPVAQAGFLPRKEALRQLTSLGTMPAQDFVKTVQQAKGGLTGLAYRLGISLADASEVALPAAEQYQTQAKQRVTELLATDVENPDIMGEAFRAQLMREMSETITQTGSMKPHSTQTGLQSPDILMRHHQAGSIFNAMKAGTEFGGSFNADGTLFDHTALKEMNDRSNSFETELTDMATITAIDIPLAELNQNRVREALMPFVEALGFNRVKPGVFRLERKGPNGEALVSIDVNAVVNQRHRENTANFLRDNNQEAGWDNNKGEAFPTGGTGQARVTDPAKVRQVAEDLVAGRKPQFMPLPAVEAKTQAGREIIERGMSLVATETPNEISIGITDELGIEIGRVDATNRPELGWTIDLIIVDGHFQRQGLGNALYRELGARLKEMGVKKIRGLVISPEALSLREKIFGIEEARRAKELVDIDQLKADLAKEHRGAFVTSRIGDVFMPRAARPGREVITAAAVRSRVTGQIWTGPMHYVAMQQATRELGGGPEIYMRHFPDQMNDQGFMTSDGRFVGRELAFEIAEKANQIDDLSDTDSRVLLSENYYMPRRRTDAKPADFAKKQRAVWVLPTGEIAVAPELHENYLAQNAEALNTRFKTNFAAKPDVKEREKALKAGFTRVRYEPNGGTMNVEIPANAWPRARAAIERLALDNEAQIDNLRVSVVNPANLKTTDSVFRRVMNDDNVFDGVTQALDELRTGRQAFLPKARREAPDPADMQHAAAKIIQQDNRTNWDARPVEVRRDAEGNILLSKDGKIKYAKVLYNFAGSFEGQKIRNQLRAERGKQDEDAVVRTKTSKVLADKLVAEFNKNIKNDPEVMRGKPWYSIFAKIAQAVFGEDVDLFGKLLATTSPQIAVRENFVYALEAYNQYKRGAYDDKLQQITDAIEDFQAGDPALVQAFYAGVKSAGNAETAADLLQTFSRWFIEKNDLAATRADGSNFGANSVGLTQALVGTWLSETAGKKTSQFYRNLTGIDWGPTIDVWAARISLRLLNQSSGRRWRIQEKNEGAVKDVDFDIAADGFRQAAERLGLAPAELQAIVWFYEKKLWGQAGWTSAAGARLGSFIEFVESMRRTPEGDLVIQPSGRRDLRGVDIPVAEAENWVVPSALAKVPIERFGPGGMVVEAQLQRQALRRVQPELAL